MHVTLESKDFYEVTDSTCIQNLSDDHNIMYVESDGQPTLTNGYLTSSYILLSYGKVRFTKDGAENLWIYNHSPFQVQVQV